jgi:anti-anti-sigma factor
MNEKVSVEITGEKNAAVITFTSSLISDMEGIVSVGEQIKEFIERYCPETVVFDFERVKFFSSQLLGMLLSIRSELKTYNGEVVISAINPQLHRVFRITNLDKVFRFFPDKESAVKAVVP